MFFSNLSSFLQYFTALWYVIFMNWYHVICLEYWLLCQDCHFIAGLPVELNPLSFFICPIIFVIKLTCQNVFWLSISMISDIEGRFVSSSYVIVNTVICHWLKWYPTVQIKNSRNNLNNRVVTLECTVQIWHPLCDNLVCCIDNISTFDAWFKLSKWRSLQ